MEKFLYLRPPLPFFGRVDRLLRGLAEIPPLLVDIGGRHSVPVFVEIITNRDKTETPLYGIISPLSEKQKCLNHHSQALYYHISLFLQLFIREIRDYVSLSVRLKIRGEFQITGGPIGFQTKGHGGVVGVYWFR